MEAACFACTREAHRKVFSDYFLNYLFIFHRLEISLRQELDIAQAKVKWEIQ